MRQGLTLIELLVVMGVVGIVMGILMPSLSRTREQARVTAVNAELRQVGIALGLYFDDHEKFPPTQQDCAGGRLTDHLYQLPEALSANRYLPCMADANPMSTLMEDRYHRGHTYKYRGVGEAITDRDIIDRWIPARLWVPDGFPSHSSIDPDRGRWYPNEDCPRASQSPVAWVVFSLGPRFDPQWLQEKLGMENRYPVPRELWYSAKERRGFVARMQLKNGAQTGSFE